MRSFSGKFVLRVPPAVHKELHDQAKALSISLNSLVLGLLKKIDSVQTTPPLSTITAAFGSELIGVVLFGSVVRDEQRKNSDIDLLLVLDRSRPIDRSLYALWDQQLLQTLGARYSPQFSHLPQLKKVSSLWLEMAMEGDVLFDPYDLVKPKLRQIRALISTGEYQRKFSHGHPYWIHKEST